MADKKYTVVFSCETENGSAFREQYDCNEIEWASNWTGKCIRLGDVESVSYTKKGIRHTRPLKRGKYVSIERMSHWTHFKTTVYNRASNAVVVDFEDWK